eukprot:jgi/Tetstr1/450264/TSEL_037300.t1
MGCAHSTSAEEAFLPGTDTGHSGSRPPSCSDTPRTSCTSSDTAAQSSSREQPDKHTPARDGVQCLSGYSSGHANGMPLSHGGSPLPKKGNTGMRPIRDSYDGMRGQPDNIRAFAKRPKESLRRGRDARTTFQQVGQIKCDSDFNVVSSDANALMLLKYNEGDLWGNPVTSIMTPLVAKIHMKMFKFLKQASASQIQQAAKGLKYDMANCRDFVLLNSNKDPVVVGVSIELAADCTSTINLYSVSSTLLHTVPRGYEAFINQAPGMHVNDYSDVICIMIDISGSTEYATSVQPQDMATLMHDVYMAVNNIILREAATQSQRHLNNMLKRYSENLHARVGVSVGDVTAGVIDGRSFRIFGRMVHLSQRLESICPKGGIACSLPFLAMLEEQQELAADMSSLGIKYSKAHMKGFGKLDYGVIDASACLKLQLAAGHLTDTTEAWSDS